MSTSLRDELGENQGQAPWLEPLGPDPAAGWYRPGLLARVLHESTPFLPSALGPPPLTATQPLPEPNGLTRNVVFASQAARSSAPSNCPGTSTTRSRMSAAGRHPLTRAGAARRAVSDALRHWPVPGLSVACSIRLTAHREEPGAPPRRT
ncbi:hypothetical protein [Streptomyces sp. NRRL S-646]|uniref:hypothetical protein n=1 Tax=Streptomyces sp. NRRL S-646 TaxID=1463917 RepID=UPI0013316BE6|nr:hypothetical protein [Streptomyces sp. NRRL S-646]